MLKALSRMIRRPRTRSFDAAGGGRRWQDAKTIADLNNSIYAGARTAGRRAGYYARNNPWVANGVNALVANLVGAGIKPQSLHPDPQKRERLHALWSRWTDQADTAGLTDLYGLQAMGARSMIEAGEAFVRFRQRRPGDGLAVPFQLELMDSEQVPLDQHRDLANGVRVRGAVEFDAIGRRAAYHVYRARPGDGPLSIDLVRVPASEMLHLFTPLAPGQVRGVTWLLPILLRLHELDGMEDAALVGAKVRAMFAGFITDPDGSAGGFADDASSVKSIIEAGLEPGTLYNLPPGRNVAFAEPPRGGSDYQAFVKNQLHAIAAGLGVTYEQLTGDLENVNYSSIRAGLVEFRRRAELLQFGTIVHQLCRPVWERWVRLAILSGAIEAPDFAERPAAYLTAKWLPPAWEWVDPQKDATAEIALIEAGLKSRSEAISERGFDPEQVDAEIAADQARADRLGIRPARRTATTAQENPNAGDA